MNMLFLYQKNYTWISWAPRSWHSINTGKQKIWGGNNAWEPVFLPFFFRYSFYLKKCFVLKIFDLYLENFGSTIFSKWLCTYVVHDLLYMPIHERKYGFMQIIPGNGLIFSGLIGHLSFSMPQEDEGWEEFSSSFFLKRGLWSWLLGLGHQAEHMMCFSLSPL